MELYGKAESCKFWLKSFKNVGPGVCFMKFYVQSLHLNGNRTDSISDSFTSTYTNVHETPAICVESTILLRSGSRYIIFQRSIRTLLFVEKEMTETPSSLLLFINIFVFSFTFISSKTNSNMLYLYNGTTLVLADLEILCPHKT